MNDHRELKEAQSSALKVDSKNHVIKNVSLITANVPCAGHTVSQEDKTPLWTDLETVMGAERACAERKKVPVRLDHGSGFKDQVGYVTNFAIKDGKLRGDLVLLEKHDRTPVVLEQAEKMPECLGLSLSFSENAPEKNEDKSRAFARVKDVAFADIVCRPAANPTGMFCARDEMRKLSGEVESGGESNRGTAAKPHSLTSSSNMNGTAEKKEGLTPEEELEQLRAENERLQNELEQEQAAGEELAQIIESGAEGEEEDAAEEEGEDEAEAEGEAPETAEEAVAELAALVMEFRELRASLHGEMRWLQEFRGSVERELAAQDEAEEQRELGVIAETVDAQSARIRQLEAENAALKDLRSGVSTGSPTAVIDHGRALTVGNDHPFAARIRQFTEEGKTRATAIIEARKADPEGFRDWSSKRRAGLI